MKSRPAWLPTETERLTLREFRLSDEPDLHEYASDPQVSRYMPWGPNDAGATRAYLDGRLAEQEDWPRLHVEFGIELKAERRLIGGMSLTLHDSANQTAGFGYTLNRRYWSQGLATEAARAILQIAFRQLKLHRVWATCDTRNAASLRVMQKLGMRHEGTFRQDVFQKGEWRDTHLCAILAEEWGG